MSTIPTGYVLYKGEYFHPDRIREIQANRKPSGAKPEQAVCHEPLAEAQGKGCNAPRYTVSITSFRRRLLDVDNLIGGTKYFTDSLRYSGIIPGDSPDKITIEVSQVKCKNERTEITITTP